MPSSWYFKWLFIGFLSTLLHPELAFFGFCEVAR
jgi:hypothetical protein